MLRGREADCDAENDDQARPERTEAHERRDVAVDPQAGPGAAGSGGGLGERDRGVVAPDAGSDERRGERAREHVEMTESGGLTRGVNEPPKHEEYAYGHGYDEGYGAAEQPEHVDDGAPEVRLLIVARDVVPMEPPPDAAYDPERKAGLGQGAPEPERLT